MNRGLKILCTLPYGRVSASGRIPKDGKEMADRTRDDEQMPREVTVAETVGGEEARAGSVRHAARHQPNNT